MSHYDVMPVLDIYANVDGTDLGSVTRKIQKIVDEHQKDLPRGSRFALRGQSDTMRKSYIGLLAGPLVISILLVYLLIVVKLPVVARSVPDHSACRQRWQELCGFCS